MTSTASTPQKSHVKFKLFAFVFVLLILGALYAISNSDNEPQGPQPTFQP
ncbi:MAG: hypothetical protein ABSE59_08120 [Opitutaceae bacterium]|jgi:hypothetical protein